MNMYSIVGILTTVVGFLAFLGIVAWAWSARRKQAFDEAANAPFALPDDGAEFDVVANPQRTERRS